MGPLAGILAALALIAYLGFWGGLVEFFFPAAPQASASPSSSFEVDGSAALPLSFPLPYAATVTQSGDGIDEPRTRFYVSTSTKGAQ
jgi:hypothetical protein